MFERGFQQCSRLSFTAPSAAVTSFKTAHLSPKTVVLFDAFQAGFKNEGRLYLSGQELDLILVLICRYYQTSAAL